MKLYYSPFACSLASRVVCLEGDLAMSYCRADLRTKRVEGGEPGALLAVNPMGKVPALVCDDGAVLTENVAVLLYLGDHAPPDRGLTAPERTPARYDLVRWLAFVSTELHKRVLATVFSLDEPSEIVKDFARHSAAQPLAVLDAHLGRSESLAGDRFTVADAYLTWALLLLRRPACGVSLAPYRAVAAYFDRQMQRASFRDAVATELREYQEPGWWTASQLKNTRDSSG
jgi:glutathione S-transferase